MERREQRAGRTGENVQLGGYGQERASGSICSGEILSGSVSTCNPNRGGIGVKATQVESVTLDSIMDDLRIGKCDFLKMDCEGAEYEILRNTSRRTFRKIGRISMECHGNRMSEAETMLKEAGFDIVCARPGITGVLKAVNTHSDGAEFIHLSRVKASR